MMTNAQMKPNRFKKWADARRTFNTIIAHLTADGRVQVTTYTRSTVYTKKHVKMFSYDKFGVYVQSGKSRVDISYTSIRLID